ncbi:hypothetical protein CH252_20795 [Rhodococcus sp. 06-1477-1B]|nr:hypothetical protein CH252_20795 [Rhodococcus sp. 06-1477-1B]
MRSVFFPSKASSFIALAVAAGIVISGLQPVSVAEAASDRGPAPTHAPTPDFGTPVDGESAPEVGSAEDDGDSSDTAPAVDDNTLAPTESITVEVSQPEGASTEHASSPEPSGDWKQVGDQPIEIAATDATTSDLAVNVQVVEPETVPGQSALEVELSIPDGSSSDIPVAVRVARSALRNGVGGDYEERLRWFQVPESAREDGGVDFSQATELSPVMTDDHVTVTPTASRQMSSVMATSSAGSSTGAGTYAATPLKSASTWDVTEQTGAFTWNYNMALPGSDVGPQPTVGLSYNSQAVDGQTGSTNNQPSFVGEGWDLSGTGFIERKYVPCAVDDGASGAVTTSGDLCWKSDNATLSMAGRSGALVRDSGSGAWKLANDDGTRFEKLSGTGQGCAPNGTTSTECWRMTTTDGTQYFFGLNRLPGWTSGNPTTNSTWTVPVFGNDPGEPCNASTFAASSCTQAWRWNLDYVVDVNGNAMAYYYTPESNKYAKNGSGATSYIRGGVLSRVDYGLRSNDLFNSTAAAYQVAFSYDSRGRCNDTSGASCTTQSLDNTSKPANPSSYPDVPWDQLCTAASCSSTQVSPSFFTNARLSTVEAKVLVGTSYSSTDSWSLSHSFPAPGDGSSAALWLTKVQHTGSRAGQTPITEPATEFSGTTMQNRVWTVDGLVPLTKWRVSSIKDSLGAVTSVNYAPAQCQASEASTILANPQSNSKWCFPEWWSPQNVASSGPRLDLFHKYPVTSTIVDAVTGPALSKTVRTQYQYGTPRWRYNDSPLTPGNRRTWGIFAGVDTVEVREGDPDAPSSQKVTKNWYYQGMNGDRAGASGGTKSATVAGTSIADERWFGGQIYRQQVIAGVGGTVQSDTLTTPWASAVRANDGTLAARMVRIGRTVLTEPVSTGGTRSVDTETTFEATYGLPVTQSTVSSDASSKCVSTSYATANTSAWLVGVVSEVRSVAQPCSALSNAQYPRDLISQERTAYDRQGWGGAPTKGMPTAKEAVTDYSNGQPVWAAVSTSSYDDLGRPLVTTDPLGRTTTLGYTPAAKLPVTGVSSTNTAPFNWSSNIVYEPTTGTAVTSTDAKGAVTSVEVDALGRIKNVWLPLRPKDSNASSPSIAYEYTLSQTSPNTLKTTTYKAGSNVGEYQLFDGLARKVQTQGAASGGGTVVATTAYDSQGRPYTVDNPYWTTSVAPSTALFVPDSPNAIPSATVTSFDALGRPTKVATLGLGQEKFFTSNTYLGADRVDTLPPSGGTPTSTFTNSMAQQVKLTQYLSTSISGTAQNTTYTYSAAGKLTGMTDPAGNAWTWTYDLRGFRTAQTDPDSGSSTATYDNAGNMTSTKDARGQTLVHKYDALNRKTETRSGSSTGAMLSAWTYDTIKKGLVTSSSSYLGSTPNTAGAAYTSTVVSYNAAGDPTRSTVSIPSSAPAFGGSTFTTVTGYYADSQPSVRTTSAMGPLPSEQVLYSYDAWGRLSGIGGNGLILGSTVYTPIGQLSQFNRLNTDVEAYSTYGYDSVTGANTSILDNAVFGREGHWVADRVYTRDNAGNITSSTTKAVLPTQTTQVNCYSYDSLRQLTRVFTPADASTCNQMPSSSAIAGPAATWKEYSYDTKTGNRTKVVNRTAAGAVSTSDYSYPTAGASRPHAVTSVSGSSADGAGSYGYDQAGNMTSRPGQTVTFNEFGKVATVTVAASSVTQSNVYDATGNLLLRNSSAEGVTLFLGDTVLTQAPNGGAIRGVRTYAAANGIPVAERSATAGVVGTVVTWLFADINGTVDTQTVAKTGVTTKQYRDPFGRPIGGTSGVWADGNGFLNKPLTASSGLTSVGARNYDPVIGKFISVDPIVDPSKPQQNFGYAYSGNNPVTWKDPTGLRLDEGCGWGRTCEARTTGVVQASSQVGKGGASKWGVGASGCGWKLACPSSQATGRSISPGGIGRAKAPLYTPGSSSGGKVPFTTQVLKSTAPLVDPGFGLGLHKTDFMHDYPLARSLVNAPMTAFGIALAYANGGSSCSPAPNGLIVCGGSFNPGGGGTTFGDTFVTRDSYEAVIASGNGALIDHEIRHSEQWAGFGPVGFVSYYYANVGVSMVATGSPGLTNYFEMDAGLVEGGYVRIK